jgi:hypothetical protein
MSAVKNRKVGSQTQRHSPEGNVRVPVCATVLFIVATNKVEHQSFHVQYVGGACNGQVWRRRGTCVLATQVLSEVVSPSQQETGYAPCKYILYHSSLCGFHGTARSVRLVWRVGRYSTTKCGR